MARPRNEHPTPAELEILKILWERGPSTVRDVLAIFEQRGLQRAYTSVMSLMNVMAEKGLLTREPQGRAFVYTAGSPQDATLKNLVVDLWQRAFEGSASTLVAHLLEEANPGEEELQAIRDALDEYERLQSGEAGENS